MTPHLTLTVKGIEMLLQNEKYDIVQTRNEIIIHKGKEIVIEIAIKDIITELIRTSLTYKLYCNRLKDYKTGKARVRKAKYTVKTTDNLIKAFEEAEEKDKQVITSLIRSKGIKLAVQNNKDLTNLINKFQKQIFKQSN